MNNTKARRSRLLFLDFLTSYIMNFDSQQEVNNVINTLICVEACLGNHYQAE